MFSVYCQQCGSALLLGPANIVAVQNTADGIAVHFRCHAGHSGVWSVGASSDRRGARQRTHAPVFASASTTPADASARRRRLHRTLTHRTLGR